MLCPDLSLCSLLLLTFESFGESFALLLRDSRSSRGSRSRSFDSLRSVRSELLVISFFTVTELADVDDDDDDDRAVAAAATVVVVVVDVTDFLSTRSGISFGSDFTTVSAIFGK